jgi:serine/threonine-protein kinase
MMVLTSKGACRLRTILSPQDWSRLQDLFDQAVELAPENRAAFLASACTDAPELKPRVESLLASFDGDTKVSNLIGSMANDAVQPSLPVIGSRLGPYKITGIIGQGGMGVVYRAVRDDDEYRKEVAIKVAAISQFTPGLHERFLRERQILADLDHPHIARLLDGGTTPEGMPFVVMEFVAGQPIDAYCTEKKLTRQARILLMIRVARAVDYAHRYLVVHRDLKPDNIHVTQEGEPKLLDFGIAKALHPEAAGFNGALTQDTMRLMTPDYASPEQVRGEAISTATDVYQLGVLLYLLLTGNRPIVATNTSMGALERAICETAPARPGLDADLDRILLQALEKEPARRYASAGALADDLQRYLDGYPVLAHQPSWAYQTNKFIRRHRLAVAAAALILLLIGGFAIGMSILARQKSQQARIANQTTDFLLALFEANDPAQGRGDKITARELLDKGAANLERSSQSDPVVQVRLLDSMGAIYNSLGDSDKAKEMLEKSLRLRLERLGKDDVAEADTVARLADVETDLSHYDESIQLNQRALGVYRRRFNDSFGGKDERIAIRLARISSDYWEQDKMPQAEAYEREALALSTRLVGRHDPRTLEMIGDLGTIIDLQGKALEAEPYYNEFLAAEQSLTPKNLPDLGLGWNYLGWLHYRLGRFAESEQEMRNALAFRILAYGEKNPVTAGARASLAYILLNRGKADEALSLSIQAKKTLTAIYGLTHRETTFAEDSLGLAFLAKGRTAEARQEFDAALTARLVLLPPNHMQTGKTWMFLAMADDAANNLALAADESRKSLDIMQSVYGPHGHPQLAEFDAVMLEILVEQHKLSEAEEFGAASVAAFRKLLPPGNPRLAAVESGLGWAFFFDGKFDQATPLLRDALSIDRSTYGPALERTAQAGIRLAACLLATGHAQEAERLLRDYRATVLNSPQNRNRLERAWLHAHPASSSLAALH